MKLINKTLIAVGAISSTIGLSFLGAYVFTKQSDQINGGENQTKLNLTDLFSTGNDFVAFVAPADKETEIASYNHETGKIKYFGQEMDFNVFFKKFLENNNNETPIMRISKNGLNFFNEYLEAVSPKEFYDYVEWFVKNVAWGPEALTLQSFAIVRDISKDGNAVILGGHKTKDKETKTIKFYPDSFFGSLPLYDITSGPSNAKDRLLQDLNKKLVSTHELNEYLDNVDKFNIIGNDLTPSKDRINFRNLSYAHLLKNKKVFTFDLDSGQPFFIEAKNKVEALDKIIDFNKKQTDPSQRIAQNLNLINEVTIKNISLVESSLSIEFGEGGSRETIIPLKDFSNFTKNNLDQLEKIMTNSIISFRDIYNIGQYKNKNFVIYEMDEIEHPKIYENLSKAKDELGSKFDETKVKQATLNEIKVENKKLKLEFSNDKNEIIKTLEFDGDDKSEKTFLFFFGFKRALNYKALVSPFIARPDNNTIATEDQEAKTFYKIYNQVYQDLIETVLFKYPHLARLQEGEHLVKYVDENGSYKYKMENGSYVGLNISDRIPFLMLLSATSKNFKGVGIDFLKYVGAHEYGHHTTLQNIQNIGDGNTPVLLGSLSGTSTPKESQYFNASVLREYLKARTKSLDFKQGALDEPEEEGPYAYFKWTDSNTGKETSESFEDIWGSNDKKVVETLTNKRRRFVQDIDGLIEAAKLRGMTINELFILNSYDNNSGTINPQISGPAQFFDEKRSFQTPTISSLFELITDGQGNKIKYDPKTFSPIVIEYEADNETVKAVKIFTKNGDPVINVKPGEKLTNSQKVLENQIKSTLTSFLYRRFFATGWNKSTTNLNKDVSLMVNYYSKARYIESISENNKSSGDAVAWIKKYFENRDNEEADENLGLWEKIVKENIDLYRIVKPITNQYSLQNQIDALLSGQDAIFRINKSVLKFKSNNTEYFADFQKLSTTNPVISATWTPKEAFENVFYKSKKFADSTKGFPPIFHLLDDNGVHLANALNSSIKLNKPIVAVHGESLNQLNSKETSSVFEAYLPSMLVDYTETIEGKVHTFKTLGFKSMEQWAEFSSLDFTKISTDKKIINNKEIMHRVFDIDYVKTKFDLVKFKENYINWVNSNEYISDKSPFLKKVETEQDVANEVMERFLNNTLQFLFKNSKVSTDFKNVAVAFDSQLGISSFKTKDFVLKEEPNREEYEINIKDLEKVVKDFLKLNNIVKTNGSVTSDYELTTYDLLLLSGKMYIAYKKPTWKQFTEGILYAHMLQFYFKPFGPSADVINYIDNPTETNLSGIFSDYTNLVAETLTRDFVQITYAPGTNDFETLPSYVKGISESNTGFEYFLSASETSIWKESLFSFKDVAAIVHSVISNYSNEFVNRNIEEFVKKIVDKDEKIIELKKYLEVLEFQLLENNKKQTELSEKNALSFEAEIKSKSLDEKTAASNEYFGNLEYEEWKFEAVKFVQNNIEFYKGVAQSIIKLKTDNYEKQKQLKIDEKAKLDIILDNENSTSKQKEDAIYQKAKIDKELAELKIRFNEIDINQKMLQKQIANLEKESQIYESISIQDFQTFSNKIADELLKEKNELKILQEKESNENKNRLINLELDKKAIAKLEEEAIEITKKIENRKQEIEAQTQKLFVEESKTKTLENNLLSSKNNLESEPYIDSSFFGQNNRSNDGYFYDRWIRKQLDWGIYDDLGQSIEKKDIRITDLKENKVNDVATATWMYLLKSKGVSLGTLTGNWRDKERDANVFWGYVPIDLGKKIKYLTFENTFSGEKVYLEIKVDGTNNLFYYKRAGDESTKITLKDEGYSSWTTNYAFVSKYKNSLLKPNNTYKVYFVDENKKIVEGLNLIKNTNLLGENNKTVSQSPTYFFKKEEDKDGVYYFIQNQFNV